jgi:hypothetical protein
MRRLCLITALCALGPLIAAAPAQAVTKAIWGERTLPGGNSAFPTYRELGVDVYQFQIHFDKVAPTRPANPRNPADPAYKWPAEVDFIVNEAAANGVGLAAMIQFSPPWANGGQNKFWAPDNRAFADFAFAASRRYPSIKRWMVWGEPMYGLNFQPMPAGSPTGPRRYGELVDATYEGLKQASPTNLVIGGNTLALGLIPAPDFIKWMRLPNGQMPRMDLWGHNPFDIRYPNIADDPIAPPFRGLNDIDTLHADLRVAYEGISAAGAAVGRQCGKGKKGKAKKASKRKKACLQASLQVVVKRKKICKRKGGGERKKACKRKTVGRIAEPPRGVTGTGRTPNLWVSEFTYVSDHPTPHFGNDFFLSAQDQAGWLSAAYAMASKLPYVDGLGWFTLMDEAPATSTSANWGLIRPNGDRKPSFFAYAAVP